MKIIKIPANPSAYSSNIYFVRGDFNSLSDVNTVIDTGGDGNIIVSEIKKINTGAGKKPVEQVILTHNHFDHTGGVQALKDAFDSKIYGYSSDKLIDRKLKNDDVIKIGDRNFQVIYAPEHSNDSICLYSWDDKVLFSGDTPIDIKSPGGSYSRQYLEILEKLLVSRVETIYPGHGPAINNGHEVILRTLEIVKNSVLI